MTSLSVQFFIGTPVDKKMFDQNRDEFSQSYFQKKVSNNVPRWQHNIAWAKERAKIFMAISSDQPNQAGAYGNLLKKESSIVRMNSIITINNNINLEN